MIKYRERPTAVRVEPQHLHQVISNLLGNALTHGGDHVGVSGEASGGSVVISLADVGAGVPLSVAPRV